MEWDDINLVLTTKAKETKHILVQNSGRVQRGTLVSIMGPSGSGKTSLLNVLAARTRASGKVALTGKVRVNGQAVDWQKWRHSVVYVEQEDQLFTFFTVWETLLFAARLRLPRGTPGFKVTETVEHLICMLGLDKCKNTVIGGTMAGNRVRGVSGGERKRVSIGVELIAGPTVLFLDEPTSGLDSYSALAVVNVLKKLKMKGCTIIMSIHQPRSQIFRHLDQLILLSEGLLVFAGPASAATSYFNELGFPCPREYNPADFLIDLVSLDTYHGNHRAEETRSRIELLARKCAESELGKKGPETHNVEDQNSLPNLSEKKYAYEASWWTQTRELLGRSWKQEKRNHTVLGIRAASSIIFGVLLGLVFLQAADGSQRSIQNIIGVLFFIVLFQFFQGMMGVLNTFPLEREIVLRERASKSYRASAYFCSKFVAEQPLNIVWPIIFTCIVYWMVGLKPTASAFFLLLGVLLLVFVTAIALGFIISSVAGTVEAANALGPPLVIFLVLFSGFYANTATIPAFIAWIQYISPIRWSFAALCVNEFEGQVFECDDPSLGCVPTGEDVLRRLGFENDTFVRSCAILGSMFLVLLAGAYLLLRFKVPSFAVPGDVKSTSRTVQEVIEKSALLLAQQEEPQSLDLS